jgi:hypothetical protein
MKDPVLHWDDPEAVLRRILPRLAGLLAAGATTDPRWCAPFLGAVRWSAWPDDERRAIEAFLGAWWRSTLRGAHDAEQVAAVFESCAIASRTVDPWLDLWDDQA